MTVRPSFRSNPVSLQSSIKGGYRADDGTTRHEWWTNVEQINFGLLTMIIYAKNEAFTKKNKYLEISRVVTAAITCLAQMAQFDSRWNLQLRINGTSILRYVAWWKQMKTSSVFVHTFISNADWKEAVTAYWPLNVPLSWESNVNGAAQSQWAVFGWIINGKGWRHASLSEFHGSVQIETAADDNLAVIWLV